MDEIKIQLKYNPDFFRELYYKNGQGSIFTYDATKKPIFISSFFITMTIILYFISLRNSSLSWLLVIGSLAILFCLVYTSIVIVKYQRWKNNIEQYLQKLSPDDIYALNLTERSVEVVIGSSITIETWDVFKKVHIESDYLSLQKEKETAYIFPAKSMNENDFKTLSDFVREKIK